VLKTFDRRVIGDEMLAFVRVCQAEAPCHLGGGVALAGAHLAHRLSGDVDLFCHDHDAMRRLATALPRIAAECGATFDLRQDAGTHVRGRVVFAGRTVTLDVVHEALVDLEPPGPPLESVLVESFTDLRASKLTCLLSRSEPRDLVDVLFLERAGYRPEDDLALALRKDAGIDPGVLAWLLTTFPVEPLPVMLLPLEVPELVSYRNALAERMRRIAVPGG
jgi:hypothetical protein